MAEANREAPDTSPAVLSVSDKTQKALEKHGYTRLTAIQQKSIPRALQGKDVLVAAKTGTGKTLCFAVAIVEILARQRWTQLDGVGAIVLAPTRELAIQNYRLIKRIAEYHTHTVGLLTGGTPAEEEAKFVDRISIVVATPGRLLHHMDTSPLLNTDNLRVLVFDEADRLFDGTFTDAVTAITAGLPATRQTLLFSATQQAVLGGLANTLLRDPEYIADTDTQHSMPASIEQRHVVCTLKEKLFVAYALVRRSTTQKAIFFVTTTKQSKFLCALFQKLRPGTSLLQVDGRQSTEKRETICKAFSKKQHGVLFATDVAARGLDFTGIDLVVQVDAPHSVDDYIHRVGRTGRFGRKGRSVLVLLENETPLLARLGECGIQTRRRKTAATLARIDTADVAERMRRELGEDDELRQRAENSLSSYVRAVRITTGHEVDGVEELRQSIGLGLE
ncbi:MAG: ATP-dependent RNA helicase Hca4 [Amphiamblys sp. WSBS2006]|nr:MAG: ATP-dependent RNA helicase Hca4 [Amphiamblys sp. WSBS2006]